MKVALFAILGVLGTVPASLPAQRPVPAATTAPAIDVPSGPYRADSEHSSIVFRVKHLGMAWFTARFTAFTVDFGFDAAAPEKSRLSVSIDPTSIATGVAPKPTGSFDGEVASDKRLLDTNGFPRMTFVATRIERTGPATATIVGDMTIRGVTKPVKLAAMFNGSLKAHPFSKRPVLGFSATGTLKRSDFGMSYLIPAVGDDVQIAVEAELIGK